MDDSCGTGVCRAFARLIGSNITGPLEEVVVFSKRGLRWGSIRAPARSNRQDELGRLLRSCGSVHESMRALIESNQSSAGELSQAIELLSDVTRNTSAGMNRQSDETTLASAMEELSATIQQVADHANGTSSLTTIADENQWLPLDDPDGKTIQELANDVESCISGVIRKLEQDIQQIDDILNVIRNISEQTNLLALNAAIEGCAGGIRQGLRWSPMKFARLPSGHRIRLRRSD